MTRLNTMIAGSALALTLAAPAAMAGSGSGHHGYTPDLLPQNAQAGQCYARIKSGAQYATQSEIVVIEEGYETLEVSQAQLQSVRKSVKVKDESVRYVVRQPRYRSVTEKVLAAPAYERLSVTAPQFRTVTETMQVTGPRTMWKKGNPGRLAAQGFNVLSTANGGYGTSTVAGSGGQYGSHSASGSVSPQNYASNGGAQCGPTCEIWCLVEVPGESVSYDRKVMTAPARVVRTPVAPQYVSVNKQVLVDPGGVDTVPVPAQYREIDVKELVAPAGVRSVPVAPKTGQVQTKVLVKPESHSWARVICNTGQVVGHSGAVNYPAAGGAYRSGASAQGYSSGGYASSYGDQTSQAGAGHAAHNHGSAAHTGAQYEHGNSGITYGGQSSSRYSAKQPSALIYGSSNSQAPDYGITYDSPSQPRIYGGEGMNSHHSAGH